MWSKLHGASTHFPIALVLVSTLCEAAACACGEGELRRNLRFAGTITIVLGALGGFAAAASGLIVAKGQFWGHATLLRHHQFVWPAFVLFTGLATWRILRRGEPARVESLAYLAILMLAALLVSLAGYWGGEMLSQG